MAEEGLAALAWALPRIIGDPQGPAARSDALYDAWLCGTYLGLVGTALHHKLSHVLGGAFDLPHAETHTIILPHAVAYNALAAPDAMARVARALGAADPAWAIFELAGRLGAKQALRDIGMLADGIERAVEMTMAAPTGIPARLTKTSYAICWPALGTALRLGRDLALLLLEKSGKGHIFTFRPLNERRHLSAEADQMLTSRTCQDRTSSCRLVCGNLPVQTFSSHPLRRTNVC